MKLNNIGNYNSIDDYVKAKLDRFSKSDRSFSTLFEEMFSESENVMFEKSTGYRIEKTTYGEAKKAALSKAGALFPMLAGADKNSVVGIYMDNSLDWIITFWAVLACGMNPLLMNRRLDRETLETTLKELNAVLVITDSESFSVKTVNCSEIGFEEGFVLSEFGSEFLVMSSGTSSNVKVCGYSPKEVYCQIMDSADIIKKCAEMKKHYDGELKLLTFLPFYHIFGLVAVYIWFAFFQRTFVYLADMSPDTVLNTIRRHKVTHIFAVPLFWEKVYASALAEIKSRGDDVYKKFCKGMKISEKIGDVPVAGKAFAKAAFRDVREGLFGESICFLISGGSEIRPEVLSFFNGIGYHLANGYGMTEIGITSVELSNKKKIRNAAFVGEPMSSIEYKIGDEGELWCRGGATAKYIIEKGVRKDNDGNWFNTRDMAEKVGSRYLILGRKDDLVITPTGENLNPNLIEGKIGYPACLIYDSEAARAVLLISVSRFASAEALREITENVQQRLSELKLSGQIGKIAFLGEPLMREDEFKLNRSRIRKDYLAGNLNLLTPETARKPEEDDEISEKIKSFFLAASGAEDTVIYGDTDFFSDLGGTSLDYFAMCREIQNEFGITVSQGTDTSMTKVSEFCEYIRSRT